MILDLSILSEIWGPLLCRELLAFLLKEKPVLGNAIREEWDNVIAILDRETQIISTCHESVIELIRRSIFNKESSLPQKYYWIVLHILKRCMAESKIESHLLNSQDNWHAAAINSPNGRACETLLSIIAKSQGSWTKETLREHLDSYIKPLLISNEGVSEIALPIIGNWAFYLFAWEADWFKENILPLMYWQQEHALKTEKLWHGFVYSYEYNSEFYAILHDLLKSLFNTQSFIKATFTGDDNKYSEGVIKKGFARHVALLAMRSVIWTDVTPITKAWLKSLVAVSDAHLLSRILWQIKGRLSKEEEIIEYANKIWAKIVLPILEIRLQNTTIIDYEEVKPIIELLPHLGKAFEEATKAFIKKGLLFTITEEYVHPRIYVELKEKELCVKYPRTSFDLLSYLLKLKYANFEWDISEVLDCLRILDASGIAREDIVALVESAISPQSLGAAQNFINSINSLEEVIPEPEPSEPEPS